MRQVGFLVQNGIDIDLAMSFSPAEALGWAVIFGEMKGGTFEWDTLTWKDGE